MRTDTKFLVIDDSLDVQTPVKPFVAEEKHTAISAENTSQATGSAVRDSHALIVLDIADPGGDGWRLLDRLKANSNTRNIPIVVVTGETLPRLAPKN